MTDQKKENRVRKDRPEEPETIEELYEMIKDILR
jgi:hypothetical protein